jgi:mannosyltransferase
MTCARSYNPVPNNGPPPVAAAESLPRGFPLLRDRRGVSVALLVLVLAGSALRAYQLTARSLWFDEAFSWRMIQFPFMEMIQRIGRDNHPPLHFILLKGWAALFGDSALSLRLLSVLFGGSTILGVYLFAVEAFGRDVRTGESNDVFRVRGRGIGLLAAALVAVSALQIRYSWEARMYALAAALAVFSSWALFRALRSPSQLRRWLLYGLFALLLAYTHYYCLFTLAAQAVFLAAILLMRADWNLPHLVRNSACWHVLVVAAVVFAGWLPWLPVFLRQREQVQTLFWSHPVNRWNVAELCYQMFAVPENFPTPSRQQQLLAADLCILGLWLLRRKARAAEWYILAAAAAPLIFSLLLSAPFALRYFVVTQMFLLIGLAVLIWRLPAGPQRAFAVAALLLIFAGFFSDFWSALDVAHKPGVRGAADFLRQRRRSEEPVIVCLPLFYFPILHYTPDRVGYYLYDDGRPMPHYHGTAALTAEDLITDERLRILHARRVWVVDMVGGNWGIHSVPMPPKWTVKSRHAFTDVVRLGDVIVVEYETGLGQNESNKP